MTKCSGCGVTLQSINPESNGFVDNLYEDLVCKRCFKIKHYNEYTNSKTDFEEYKKLLMRITKESLIFHIVDIFDLSNIKEINSILKFNKKILIITKKDILPKSVKEQKIISRLKEEYPFYQDYIFISSNKNYNLDFLYNKIKSYKKNEIYFVGNTNSGKSTLINKLIKNYSKNTYEITTSHFTSTTLDFINVKLNENIMLIDTPGIINEKNFINTLDVSMFKKVIVKNEIKPRVFQMKKNASFFIEDFCRIDYLSEENDLVFYISNSLNIKKTNMYSDGFNGYKKIEIQVNRNQDLVIEGLCFVKCVKSCKFSIYIKENVSVYKRDKLI